MLSSQRGHGQEITDERWYKTIKEGYILVLEISIFVLAITKKNSLAGDFPLTIERHFGFKLASTLSCCHTGRGEFKAEGVVGIAGTFLGAGARSVIVALWAIDDKATKEFMKHFFKHL